MKTKISNWKYSVEDGFDANSDFTIYYIYTDGLKNVFVDFKHLSHLIELYLEKNGKGSIYR